MRRPPRRTRTPHIILTAILLAMSAGGAVAFSRYRANQHKIAQCTQLVDRVNQGYAKAIAFQGQDVAALNNLAEDLANVAGQLRAIDVTDETLSQQRQRFAQAYRELSDAYRQMGTALDAAETAPRTESGRDRVRQAQADVKAAGAQAHQAARYVDELAIEINQYCGVASN
ncbi:hypothetical protein [Baaleninema simplex]|uniref:hypothetical protein n=1 Tax=Baaleninema simplex TaxID=2862350 RepID=UPI000366A6FF|nr:hypothetical protein [Baaleninema simplex]